MQDNLCKVIKVWQAFVKFIRSQVLTNGKAVDTQFIGLFFKDEKELLRFMPSCDYLEAGKFKLRSDDDVVDGLRDDSRASYKAAYDSKLKVSFSPLFE